MAVVCARSRRGAVAQNAFNGHFLHTAKKWRAPSGGGGRRPAAASGGRRLRLREVLRRAPQISRRRRRPSAIAVSVHLLVSILRPRHERWPLLTFQMDDGGGDAATIKMRLFAWRRGALERQKANARLMEDRSTI